MQLLRAMGRSAERMEFTSWKLRCAVALVKSAIRSSVLKRIFNDALNSKGSQLRSFAFDIRLVRAEFYFLLHCKKCKLFL